MKLESDEHLAKGGHRFPGATSHVVGLPPRTHPDVPDTPCTADMAWLGVHPTLALSESMKCDFSPFPKAMKCSRSMPPFHHSQSLLSLAGTGQATG